MNERIKLIRKTLGLSQTEFGQRLGVTVTSISKIECGNNNVTEQMLLSICREYGVNEAWLRTGTGEMFRQTDANIAASLAADYNLGIYGEQLLATYLSLSDADKRAVDRFVAQLTANVQQAENTLAPAQPEQAPEQTEKQA